MPSIRLDEGLSLHCAVDDYLWPWEAPTPVLMMHGFARNAAFWNRWVPAPSYLSPRSSRDQLKQIYIDGELEPIDTTQWFPRLNRKDFTVALNFTGNGIDDPDQNFYENYVCGAEGNYIKYCNPELDELVDRQSMEANQDKRKELVWEIERKLAEDGVRPIIFYAPAGNCRQPYVKGLTIMSNSIYNGWRMEDVWLDK